jgi:hypothetical protein
MYVRLSSTIIKFYSIKSSSNLYSQPSFLLGEKFSLEWSYLIWWTFLSLHYIGGLGLSLSPKFRLGPKPDFFIYVVKPKPEPELSLTYLVNFSSPKKPEPELWSPSPTRAQKNQARSTSTPLYNVCQCSSQV